MRKLIVFAAMILILGASVGQAELGSFTITGTITYDPFVLGIENETFVATVDFDTADWVYHSSGNWSINPVTMIFRVGEYTLTSSQARYSVCDYCMGPEPIDNLQLQFVDCPIDGTLGEYTVKMLSINFQDHDCVEVDPYYDWTAPLDLDKWDCKNGTIQLVGQPQEDEIFFEVEAFIRPESLSDFLFSIGEVSIKSSGFGSNLGTVRLDKLHFDLNGELPAPEDLIMVVCDGATLFRTSFGQFEPVAEESYVFGEKNLKVELDFNDKTLFVQKKEVDLSWIDNFDLGNVGGVTNGLNVRFYIGDRRGVLNVPIQALKMSYEP